MLRRHGAFNAKLFGQLVIGVLVELRYDLGHAAVKSIVGYQKVFLIHSRESDKGVRSVKPLLVQQLMLCTVAADNHGARPERSGYIVTALVVLFDYFDAVAASNERIAQILRNTARTEQHHMLCPLLQYAHVAKKLLHVLRSGYKS